MVLKKDRLLLYFNAFVFIAGAFINFLFSILYKSESNLIFALILIGFIVVTIIQVIRPLMHDSGFSSLLYFAIAIICLFTSNMFDLTTFLFIFLACALNKSKKACIVMYFMHGLCAIMYIALTDLSPVETTAYIVAALIIVATLEFIKIYRDKKPVPTVKFKKKDVRIVNLLYNGDTIKEIAYTLSQEFEEPHTPASINKRIQRMRQEINVENNFQLVSYMIKCGQIEDNLDIMTL